MNHHYGDIRRLTAAEPLWFDEHAVPRYCEFAPDQCANIYADRCALILIACQNCGREFKVAETSDQFYRHLRGDLTLWDDLASFHFGDPPNVECCGAGPTMNCIDRRVLEAWQADFPGDWKRMPEHEIELDK